MPRRPALAGVLLVLALVIFAAWLRAREPGPAVQASTPGAGEGRVVKVVDGDTIDVDIDGRRETVRLLGIDTPETVDPRRPVQCFGRQASDYLKTLLPRGTPVRLVADVELRDQYARLLAYVYRVDDGLFVNLKLVQEGYAAPLTYTPNVAHADEIVAASAEARTAGRGRWSAC